MWACVVPYASRSVLNAYLDTKQFTMTESPERDDSGYRRPAIRTGCMLLHRLEVLLSHAHAHLLVAQDTIKIMLATDNHIGYLERDPIRGQDAINTFEEILQLAVRHDVRIYPISLAAR